MYSDLLYSISLSSIAPLSGAALAAALYGLFLRGDWTRLSHACAEGTGAASPSARGAGAGPVLAGVGAGMAAPVEARSSCDKEELKEKLASLQKEYRKTFGRLQRAARTEKVKSHVKETIARQNCWLLQAAAEEDPAASSCQVAPEASASHLPGSCSETNALRTPSVTFNLEPEVFSPGGSLPENWGSVCPDRTHGRILRGLGLPALEKKPSRLSRSRRKGPPRGPLEERREDTPEAGKEGPSLEGPQSPVFTRLSSSFEIDRRILTMPLAAAAREGSSPSPSLTPQPESPHGENITPKVLHPLPGILLEESRGLSPEPLWTEGISATPEDSAVKDMPFLAHVQKASKEKERGREGEEEGRCRSASSEGAREPCQERSLPGEPQSSSCLATESPVSKPGEAGSRGEAEAGSPPLQAVSPSTPTHSLLDSCTVVEGLLFPVEYYVRTTRRMSRCQRELNLEAVIRSQLGKRRRRGRRVSLKDTVPSPTPSAQELPGSGALSAPPQAGRERRSGSPLALESPRAGEGLPQSGTVTRQRRKGRGRPRHGTPSHGAREPLALGGLEGNGCLGSSERCQPEPQEQAGNWDHSGMEPAPRGKMSSPPGRRRSRPCVGVLLGCPLQWLPSDLALQEFHLPAEEFGLLQSEKVRASARKPPEAVGSGEPLERLQGADPANLQAVEESPGDVLFPPEDESSELCLPPQDLHSSKLLLSPTDVVLEGGISQLESHLPTPLFPLVGTTPATQDFRGSPGQGQANPSQEPSAKAAGTQIRGTGEERSRVAMLCPKDGEGASWKPDEPGVQVEARQELTAKSGEQCEASVNQQEKAEDLAAGGPTHRRGEGNWKMTSKLKNSAGSCTVDLSAVWWEIADFTELCVVTACEASVALWRHLDSGCWETVHTWSFAEGLCEADLVSSRGDHFGFCCSGRDGRGFGRPDGRQLCGGLEPENWAAAVPDATGLPLPCASLPPGLLRLGPPVCGFKSPAWQGKRVDWQPCFPSGRIQSQDGQERPGDDRHPPAGSPRKEPGRGRTGRICSSRADLWSRCCVGFATGRVHGSVAPQFRGEVVSRQVVCHRQVSPGKPGGWPCLHLQLRGQAMLYP
ncbi:partner and localizer of BRCA2 isoform X3 [Sphaerodactylus townsendi]|nr:partner and localizer of BRCA2 isoform X3 [Sphaerodactylus townsendi]